MSKAWATLAGTVALSLTIAAQQDSHDYWRVQREMIQRGQQAIFMCNGLFTSNRTLEQIFAQELKFLPADRHRRAAATTSSTARGRRSRSARPGGAPVMRAAFREGLGCVILAPDQTFDDIDELPRSTCRRHPAIRRDDAWPDGDLVTKAPLPAASMRSGAPGRLGLGVQPRIARAGDAQPARGSRDQIIHERYAPGVDVTTRTRTWSTAKSMAATLFGILVDQGKLELDEPLGIEWLPRAAGAACRTRGRRSRCATC